MNRRKIITGFLDNLIWLLLLIVVVIFSFLTDRFLTANNITNIFVHAAVLGVLVVGQSYTLITGNFDLSAESILAFCALVGAWLILPKGAPTFGGGIMLHPIISIIILLLLGLGFGWLNGFLITRLKMNNFIVTLAMLIVIRGFMLIATGGNTMTKLPEMFKALGHDYIGPVPISVIVMILVFVIGFIVLQYRPFGRSLYAVGGSRDAALASGIDPDRRIRQVYLISGMLAAMAGWMLAGRTGVVVENMGEGKIFEIQAAAVIGGISLSGGRGSLIGAFGGVLLLSAIDSGLSLMRLSSFWIEIARGLIILLAMLIDAQKVRYLSQSSEASKSVIANGTAPGGVSAE
jgi:ribose/xylose/arabinose/galactoside ABC-type transport system permease subunit